MRELVCIVCPKGCTMQITESDGEITVTGNSCKRGEQFAVSEMTAPKRTICTTVRTAFKDVPVLPVRVSAEIPKDRIFDVMHEINQVCVSAPVSRGDTVLENVLGLGVNIIATSDILKNAEIKEG
ncbi:MAG: DUF1667 domain-containing protein [Candidatus Fimenecus sp.]